MDWLTVAIVCTTVLVCAALVRDVLLRRWAAEQAGAEAKALAELGKWQREAEARIHRLEIDKPIGRR